MTVADVSGAVSRMRAIAGETPAGDGAHVFNGVYLPVTETVAERLATAGLFHDQDFMAELTVRFAGFWFAAYDSGDHVPRPWEPLFTMRSRGGVLPIQFALAGMNTHIEHDLPLAVLATCAARHCSPTSPGVRDDYEIVNDLLADAEARIRRTFLTELEQTVDDHLAPVAHLVSSWSIAKARDAAWVTLQTLWALRGTGVLYDAYADALARAVGMGSRLLLTSID